MTTVDPSRIREAAQSRKRQLRLTNHEICKRADLAPRTVTALLHDRVNEDTLRKASRALDWPEDALWLIGAGELTPERVPDLPWVDEEAMAVEQRLARVEVQSVAIEERLERIERTLERAMRLLQAR